jgi:hypothetical protein
LAKAFRDFRAKDSGLTFRLRLAMLVPGASPFRISQPSRDDGADGMDPDPKREEHPEASPVRSAPAEVLALAEAKTELAAAYAEWWRRDQSEQGR